MKSLASTVLLDKPLYGGKETVGLRTRGACAPKSICLEFVLDRVLLGEGCIQASLSFAKQTEVSGGKVCFLAAAGLRAVLWALGSLPWLKKTIKNYITGVAIKTNIIQAGCFVMHLL